MESDFEQMSLPTMTADEFARHLRKAIRRGHVDPHAMLDEACTALDLLEPEVIVGNILPERWLSKLLPAVWTRSVSFPSMWAGSDTWVRLFRRAGFVSNVPSMRKPPQEDMVVYRGTPKADRSSALRLSWTTNREMAIWYANRLNFLDSAQPTVWEAVVPGAGVLGLFEEGTEVEVVVNPRQLRSVKATPAQPLSPTSWQEAMLDLYIQSRIAPPTRHKR
jgi:hypothetical protein